jgi:hypothetical protein
MRRRIKNVEMKNWRIEEWDDRRVSGLKNNQAPSRL